MPPTIELLWRGPRGEPVDGRTLETTLGEGPSAFYELVREDELPWCALGAGRMLRADGVAAGRAEFAD